MTSLTENFVCQIERLFSFAQMLEATGQTAEAALPEWNRLLAAGRIAEVKGCDVPYFRYKAVVKTKATSKRHVSLGPRRLRFDQGLIDLVRANPGQSALKLSTQPQCPQNYSALLRTVNRLLQSGLLVKVEGGLYLRENVTQELARQLPPEPKPQVKERLQVIWSLIRVAGKVRLCNLVEQTAYPDRTIRRYLTALIAEGYVEYRKPFYCIQKPEIDVPQIRRMEAYQ